jgi:hypothetical protein
VRTRSTPRRPLARSPGRVRRTTSIPHLALRSVPPPERATLEADGHQPCLRPVSCWLRASRRRRHDRHHHQVVRTHQWIERRHPPSPPGAGDVHRTLWSVRQASPRPTRPLVDLTSPEGRSVRSMPVLLRGRPRLTRTFRPRGPERAARRPRRRARSAGGAGASRGDGADQQTAQELGGGDDEPAEDAEDVLAAAGTKPAKPAGLRSRPRRRAVRNRPAARRPRGSGRRSRGRRRRRGSGAEDGAVNSRRTAARSKAVVEANDPGRAEGPSSPSATASAEGCRTGPSRGASRTWRRRIGPLCASPRSATAVPLRRRPPRPTSARPRSSAPAASEPTARPRGETSAAARPAGPQAPRPRPTSPGRWHSPGVLERGGVASATVATSVASYVPCGPSWSRSPAQGRNLIEH